eukprot:2236889-Rhodomonas_salina.1
MAAAVGRVFGLQPQAKSTLKIPEMWESRIVGVCKTHNFQAAGLQVCNGVPNTNTGHDSTTTTSTGLLFFVFMYPGTVATRKSVPRNPTRSRYR